MHDQQCCCHSCSIKLLEIGITRCGVFGAALWDKFLFDGQERLIPPEYHSWVLCGERQVEDSFLDLTNPL